MTLQCHTLIQALLGSFFLSNPYEGGVNTSFYTLVVSLYLTVVVLWLYQYYGILSSLFSSKNEIHPASLYSCPVIQNAFWRCWYVTQRQWILGIYQLFHHKAGAGRSSMVDNSDTLALYPIH